VGSNYCLGDLIGDHLYNSLPTRGLAKQTSDRSNIDDRLIAAYRQTEQPIYSRTSIDDRLIASQAQVDFEPPVVWRSGRPA